MEIMYVVFAIITIFASARLLGKVFQRLKLPALVGELLAGMILGPSLFGIVNPDQSFEIIGTVGVFFLMLVAGLEMNIKEIEKTGKSAIIISLVAFLVPFVAGSLVSSWFGLEYVQSIFMGLLLSITALPVSAIVLMEFGILKSKIGNTVITAAVINDIIALAILGILIQFPANGESNFDLTSIGISVIKVAALMAVFYVSLIFGKKLFPNKESSRSYGIISGVTFGFFAPLFFGFIGVEFDAKSIINYIPLFVSLLVVAISSKIGGGFIAARICKFSKNGSIAIGTLMNGRGMMELAIASIGFGAGLIDTNLFSIAVGIGFTTTILAPLLSRPFIAKLKSHNGIEVREVLEQNSLENEQTSRNKTGPKIISTK